MARKGRYTEEQIIRALKEVEAGAKTDEVCRRLGVTQTTFYRWKANASSATHGGGGVTGIPALQVVQQIAADGAV